MTTVERGSGAIEQRFLQQCRHYLHVEYRTKLRLAVETMPQEQIWARSNDASNSVGNLLLHLAGNVRQWMLSGVGGAADHRHRDAEFAAQEGAGAEALLAALDEVLTDVDRVLAALSPADLLRPAAIQGRDLLIFDAVLHVVEHFSYHLGQVVLISKSVSASPVRFYEDAGGLAKPVWNKP